MGEPGEVRGAYKAGCRNGGVETLERAGKGDRDGKGRLKRRDMNLGTKGMQRDWEVLKQGQGLGSHKRAPGVQIAGNRGGVDAGGYQSVVLLLCFRYAGKIGICLAETAGVPWRVGSAGGAGGESDSFHCDCSERHYLGGVVKRVLSFKALLPGEG